MMDAISFSSAFFLMAFFGVYHTLELGISHIKTTKNSNFSMNLNASDCKNENLSLDSLIQLLTKGDPAISEKDRTPTGRSLGKRVTEGNLNSVEARPGILTPSSKKLPNVYVRPCFEKAECRRLNFSIYTVRNISLSNPYGHFAIPSLENETAGKTSQDLQMNTKNSLGDMKREISGELNIWKRHFGVDPSPRNGNFVRIRSGTWKNVRPVEKSPKKQQTPVVEVAVESSMTNFCGRGNQNGVGGYPYRNIVRSKFLRKLEGRQCYQIQANEWICEDWGSNFIYVKLNRGFWTANCFTTKKTKRETERPGRIDLGGERRSNKAYENDKNRLSLDFRESLAEAFNERFRSNGKGVLTPDDIELIPQFEFPIYRIGPLSFRFKRSVGGVSTRIPKLNLRVGSQPLTEEVGGKFVAEKDELSLRRAFSFEAWKLLGDNILGGLDDAADDCRTQGQFFPRSIYELETCSWCYIYVPAIAFLPKKKFQRQTRYIRLGHWSGNVSVLVNGSHMVYRSDDYKLLRNTFRDESGVEKWKSCCQKAVQCCNRMQKELPTSLSTVGSSVAFCPRTWDGWQCWRDTVNGSYAYETCPDYIYFEGEPPPCSNYATKWCGANGNWFRNERGSEWTNYSTCSAVEGIQKKSAVHMAAYAISMAALMPALLIFSMYKQLRVPRIKLHQQLFMSLFAHAVFVTLFKVAVILPDINTPSVTLTILNENGHGCKILLLLTRYFRLTNYMWMFCEGLYLHRLITAAFVENNSLMLYYLVGWGFPLIPASIYACLRVIFLDEKCWVVPIEQFEWVFYAPAIVSLIVNFLFLINIIRILLRKLRTTQDNEPSQYRKAVKGTLFLIPLFGVHLFATIYRPRRGTCEWMELYSYINLMLDGLQGSLVAIIFCYANNEIHNLLRRSYLRFRDHKRMSASNRRSSLLFFARYHSSTNDSETPGHHLIRFTFQPQRRTILLHRPFLTKNSIERNGSTPPLAPEGNKCLEL